jgi:hypothetical protein
MGTRTTGPHFYFRHSVRMNKCYSDAAHSPVTLQNRSVNPQMYRQCAKEACIGDDEFINL